MEQAEFVVLDFVMQPHPDGFAVAKGRSVDNRDVKWEELHEKVKDKVKSMLAAAAVFSAGEKATVKCETEGADDAQGHSALASFVLFNPTRQQILRIEDFLRTYVVPVNNDIPDDAQPSITVKVKDHQGRFVRFLVTDFTLSGPSKGNWKPFTEWYGAVKELGL